MIADIRDHVFPTAVALDNPGKRHGVLVPLGFIVVSLTLVEEKRLHLSLNGNFLL